MTWDTDVLAAMGIYGGGFVRALRRAYEAGDAENRRRIEQAWPEYGEQYRALALKLAAQEERAEAERLS